jgi:FixJ family two-component response regulator
VSSGELIAFEGIRMTSQEPTVYIVDDDQGARESLSALVRSMGTRSETFASGEDFLANFDPGRPGCLVTDLRMLGMSGIELQEKLVVDGISLPVILITAHAETPLTVRAVKQGAVTVLEKPCRDYELVDAIRAAIAQDLEARSKSKQTACQRDFKERLASLTDDEQRVLELMVEGVANKVIARRVFVSIRTVESRRQRIFEKTQTGSLAELIRMVVETKSLHSANETM